MLVELDGFADYVGVGIHVRAPEVVADDCVGSGIGAMDVGCGEEAAEVRLHAKDSEIVVVGLVEPACLGCAVEVESKTSDATGCYAGESSRSVA